PSSASLRKCSQGDPWRDVKRPSSRGGIAMDVRTAQYMLSIDDRTGALQSLRGVQAPSQELVSPLHATLPLFTIQYLDEGRQFHQKSSAHAQRCEMHRGDGPEETQLRIWYSRIGAHDIDVEVAVRCPHDEAFSYWSLSLSQRTPLVITAIHFPFVVVPYRYEGSGPTNILVPSNQGERYRQPRPEQLEPDYPDVWQFTEDNAHFIHYPGTTFVQFLAYYNEQHGIYLGCHDPDGRIKIIKPVAHQRGVRLGVAHVGGWDQPGEHRLGYEVALGVFSGDWYDAADIYRRWYETQAEP